MARSRFVSLGEISSDSVSTRDAKMSRCFSDRHTRGSAHARKQRQVRKRRCEKGRKSREAAKGCAANAIASEEGRENRTRDLTYPTYDLQPRPHNSRLSPCRGRTNTRHRFSPLHRSRARWRMKLSRVVIHQNRMSFFSERLPRKSSAMLARTRGGTTSSSLQFFSLSRAAARARARDVSLQLFNSEQRLAPERNI